MGKIFHKNSVYIFLLRIFILLSDLIGLNLIIWFFQVLLGYKVIINCNNQDLNWLIFLFNFSWIFLSYFFKTYIKSFQIIYNLKSTFNLFIVHSFINVLIIKFFFHSLIEFKIIVFYTVSVFLFLPLFRYFISFYLNKIDKTIHLRKRVSILGNGPLYPKLYEYLNSEDSGFRLVPILPKISAEKVNLEIFINAINLAKKHDITEIFSTIMPVDDNMHMRVVHLAENEFIRFKFVPDFNVVLKNHFKVRVQSQVLEVNYTREPLEELDNRIRKRFFDLLVSSLVIILILSWLYPIIALLIKLDSKGSVLFKQLRSGRKNKPFVCLKFRTMIPNEEQDSKQASKNDYRFTKFGAFLRKTNLDELPQFINVFLGQMSVIGPRPHMLNHTKHYGELVDSYMQRHFIKPGISGWAQINGLRGNLDQKMMELRVKYDLHYIKNWSVWGDIDIMYKTFIITLVGDDNAY